MMLESSAAHATSRLRESGVTLCEMGEIDNEPGLKMLYRVSVNSENVFVEGRVDANYVPHLMVDLQFHRRHGCIKVDTVEVVHYQDLRVSLATITGFRPLTRLSNFHDDNITTTVQRLEQGHKKVMR